MLFLSYAVAIDKMHHEAARGGPPMNGMFVSSQARFLSNFCMINHWQLDYIIGPFSVAYDLTMAAMANVTPASCLPMPVDALCCKCCPSSQFIIFPRNRFFVCLLL